MASAQKQHQMLPEPLHSRALKYSVNNLDREIAGKSTDDPENIDGEWHSLPLLYCLHIERYKHKPDDFNIHHLRGWRYGDMIIALAEKQYSRLHEAWRRLMQTRFNIVEAENRLVVDLTKDHEVIDLTGED